MNADGEKNVTGDISTNKAVPPEATRPKLFAALIVANVVLLVGGLALKVPESSNANYPSRPIKLIVPFGAGGGTDTFARVIDRSLRENDLLPVPLVIVNIGGAGGSIGSRRTRDALPDGHTLMILHEAILTAKASGVVGYGPEAFDLLAATGEIGTVLAVSQDSPFTSMSDLLAVAAEQPDSIRFAANMGALTHFVGLQLEALQPGAKLRFAQFGGGAERLSGLIGGHVDVTGFTMDEFLKFQPKGLRALAYFGEARHPSAPDVPTALEQGLQMVNSNTFYWWVPKGTPPARREYLVAMLKNAMGTEFVQTKLAKTHFNPVFLSGDAARKRIDAAGQEISKLKMTQSVDVPDIPTITIGLCVGLFCLFLWQRRTTFSAIDLSDRPVKTAAGCCCLAVVYVTLLSMGVPGFRWATIGFVLCLGFVLSEFRLSKLPAVGVLAQVLGFGLYFLFTNVLVIELP